MDSKRVIKITLVIYIESVSISPPVATSSSVAVSMVICFVPVVVSRKLDVAHVT